jgi:hypothetical protein
MNGQNRRTGTGDAPLSAAAIEEAVLGVLKAYNMPYGGPIDLVRIRHELQCNGIGRLEMNSAVVRLLERQLLTQQGNSLRLIGSGDKAFEGNTFTAQRSA